MSYFDLNVEVEESSSEESEKITTNESCTKKTIPAHLSKKFEELKQKRSRIKLRREKNSTLKRKKSNINKTLTPAINSVSTPNNQLNGVYFEPNAFEQKKLSNLEANIETAIQRGEFELAEIVSDELFKQESQIKKDKLKEATRFEESQIEKAKQKEKKQLFWRFEAKKSWETKSNM